MRPFSKNFRTAMLAGVFVLFGSGSVFAAGVPTATGSVSRGSSPTSFDVTVSVTGILNANTTKMASETDLTSDRISLIWNDLSQTPIPWGTTSSDAVVTFAAQKKSDPTITADSGSTTTSTMVFKITVTETQSGALAAKLKTYNNTVNLMIKYFENKSTTAASQTTTPIPITAAAVVAQTGPTGFKAVAGDSKVVFSWDTGSGATFIGASGAATTGTVENVGLVAVSFAGGTTNLPELVFTPSAADDAAGSGGCTLNTNFTDGNSCITCNDTNGYVDVKTMTKMQSSGVYASINSPTTSKGEINGLEIGKTYFAFMVNMPGSLSATSCYRVIPYEGQSLAQINGESKQSDNPRCFIATAAYGSPLHKNIKLFTWFRSNVLLKHDWGKAFVHWYNTYGPPAAQVIAAHPALKFGVRTILWVPALLISLWLNLVAYDPWTIAGVIAVAMVSVTLIIRKRRQAHATID